VEGTSQQGLPIFSRLIFQPMEENNLLGMYSFTFISGKIDVKESH